MEPETPARSFHSKKSDRIEPEQHSSEIVERTKKIERLSFLLPLAGITLGLCGIVFGLLQLRQVKSLTGELESLREKRMYLIDQLRASNTEITDLQSQIDSYQQPLPRAVRSTRSASQKLGAGESIPPLISTGNNPETGLPFSLDNGSVDKKLVCLTFDGSYLSNTTPEILDILERKNIKATIFISGEFMRRFPALVRQISAKGHEIGNHTFSHPRLTAYSTDQVQTTLPDVTAVRIADQLRKADDLFYSITQKHLSPIWRSPYGESNRQICEWGQRAGYLHIGWRPGRAWRFTLDSNDWVPDEQTPGYHTPQDVYDKIMALAKSQPTGINGGIILMHLGTQRKDNSQQVYTILEKLIEDLHAEGYSFGTVSELCAASDINLSNLPERGNIQ